MSSSEIAFLAVGLIIGAAIGAAIAEALRARPAPRRQVRVTISPNTVAPRRSVTLSDLAPDADTGATHGGAGDAGWVDPLPGAVPVGSAAGLVDRTPVPGSPAGVPAAAVAVPVDPAPSVPVGPGTTSSPSGPGSSPTQAPGSMVASARPIAAAAAVGVLERPDPAPPASQPLVMPATPLPSSVDVGPVGPGIAVRPRPPVADAAPPAIAAGAVAVPVMGAGAAVARLGRRAGDEPLGGPYALTAASTDPCDVPRRLVDERCALSGAAREHAKATAESLRDAQRRYDSLREHVERADRAADPRELAEAKDDLHRRFRAASDAATTADETEAAAREWLAAINELNGRAREATRFAERAAADLRAAVPALEKLARDADAARINAEAAEAACHDARVRLADCEEAAAHAAVPASVPAADEEPHPFDALWPGETDATRTQPLTPAAEPADAGGELPAVIRVLRGDRDARERLVATLAAGDADAARAWGLRLPALFDAITARAIEDGYLDLPHDDPFWGLFSFAERRGIVAALSALGYRYDGMRGFLDGRVPTARDLSLAVGYAGLDRMRIRTWPREAEAGALYEQATVAADEWLAERADDLSLGQMVEALGSRAGDFADAWNAWGRLRPALLATD